MKTKIITVKRVDSFFNLLEHFNFVLPEERRVTTEEDIENNSAGPNVAFLIVVSSQDLWSNIKRLQISNF
jgi:hypothetical protein